MGKVVVSEDEECWNIAKSMVDEIELIRGMTPKVLSAGDRPKVDFKGLFMKKIRVLGP